MLILPPTPSKGGGASAWGKSIYDLLLLLLLLLLMLLPLLILKLSESNP